MDCKIPLAMNGSSENVNEIEESYVLAEDNLSETSSDSSSEFDAAELAEVCDESAASAAEVTSLKDERSCFVGIRHRKGIEQDNVFEPTSAAFEIAFEDDNEVASSVNESSQLTSEAEISESISTLEDLKNETDKIEEAESGVEETKKPVLDPGVIHKSEEKKSVYKMPISEYPYPEYLLFWPANFFIQAVIYQLKLIFYGCSTMVTLFTFFYQLLTGPVQKTADVKEQLMEFLNPVISHVSRVGPKVGTLAVKCGWGILAVSYVALILTILIVPVIVLESFFLSPFVEQPLDTKMPLHFDYTLPRPSASIPLTQLLAANNPKAVQPFSWDKLHVTVILTLPESDYNRQLGMFQVTAELVSEKPAAEVVERSSRPCMLRYQSAPIRYAKTMLYGIPVLLDVTGEYERLEVKLIEMRRERNILIGSVRILLEPRAGFLPGSGLPEIYAAEVHIRSELPWNKLIVYKWKWTIYVWTATALFITEVALVLCCCRPLLLPKLRKPHYQQHHPQHQQQEQQHHHHHQQQQQHKKKKSSKRVSFQE